MLPHSDGQQQYAAAIAAAAAAGGGTGVDTSGMWALGDLDQDVLGRGRLRGRGRSVGGAARGSGAAQGSRSRSRTRPRNNGGLSDGVGGFGMLGGFSGAPFTGGGGLTFGTNSFPSMPPPPLPAALLGPAQVLTHDFLHSHGASWVVPPGSVWTPTGLVIPPQELTSSNVNVNTLAHAPAIAQLETLRLCLDQMQTLLAIGGSGSSSSSGSDASSMATAAATAAAAHSTLSGGASTSLQPLRARMTTDSAATAPEQANFFALDQVASDPPAGGGNSDDGRDDDYDDGGSQSLQPSAQPPLLNPPLNPIPGSKIPGLHQPMPFL